MPVIKFVGGFSPTICGIFLNILASFTFAKIPTDVLDAKYFTVAHMLIFAPLYAINTDQSVLEIHLQTIKYVLISILFSLTCRRHAKRSLPLDEATASTAAFDFVIRVGRVGGNALGASQMAKTVCDRPYVSIGS